MVEGGERVKRTVKDLALELWAKNKVTQRPKGPSAEPECTETLLLLGVQNISGLFSWNELLSGNPYVDYYELLKLL